MTNVKQHTIIVTDFQMKEAPQGVFALTLEINAVDVLNEPQTFTTIPEPHLTQLKNEVALTIQKYIRHLAKDDLI